MASKNHRSPAPQGSSQGYVSEYVHYRTKKLMKAKDYGYKAWPFGPQR